MTAGTGGEGSFAGFELEPWPALREKRVTCWFSHWVGLGVGEAQAHFHMGAVWGRLGREDGRSGQVAAHLSLFP